MLRDQRGGPVCVVPPRGLAASQRAFRGHPPARPPVEGCHVLPPRSRNACGVCQHHCSRTAHHLRNERSSLSLATRYSSDSDQVQLPSNSRSYAGRRGWPQAAVRPRACGARAVMCTHSGCTLCVACLVLEAAGLPVLCDASLIVPLIGSQSDTDLLGAASFPRHSTATSSCR